MSGGTIEKIRAVETPEGTFTIRLIHDDLGSTLSERAHLLPY